MIMFSLEWWNYALMGAIVFISASTAGQIMTWREARREPDPEYPCLVHLGTQKGGCRLYCGLAGGHTGVHGGEVLFTVQETVLNPCEDEWPVTSDMKAVTEQRKQ